MAWEYFFKIDLKEMWAYPLTWGRDFILFLPTIKKWKSVFINCLRINLIFGRGRATTSWKMKDHMNEQTSKYLYLGNSSLQYHIVNRQGRCIEHGHHHNQHVRSAGGTVRSKVEEHANTVLIVGCHRQHFTWRQTGHSQSGTGRHALFKESTLFSHSINQSSPSFLAPSLTRSDGFQGDVHIAQGDVCGSGWAALEGRVVAGGQRVEQWAARGRAQALGLGVG